MENAEEGIEQLATMLIGFRTRLIEGGFSVEMAEMLVLEWWRSQVS